MIIQEAPSPSSSLAELRVREIASRIGLHEDSEILRTVCHKLREEYVVELWQLPEIDSLQWEKLQAPVGLAVAVKRLSSTTSSSLGESTTLDSLLGISHEREQEHEGFRTSSIFRSNKKNRSNNEGEGDIADDDYGVKEDGAADDLMGYMPSELPPLVLKTSEGSSFCTDIDERQQEEEVNIVSIVEKNGSEDMNQVPQASLVGDKSEAVKMNDSEDMNQQPLASLVGDKSEAIKTNESEDMNEHLQASLVGDTSEAVKTNGSEDLNQRPQASLVDDKSESVKTNDSEDMNQQPRASLVGDTSEAIKTNDSDDMNQWPHASLVGDTSEAIKMNDSEDMNQGPQASLVVATSVAVKTNEDMNHRPLASLVGDASGAVKTNDPEGVNQRLQASLVGDMSEAVTTNASEDMNQRLLASLVGDTSEEVVKVEGQVQNLEVDEVNDSGKVLRGPGEKGPLDVDYEQTVGSDCFNDEELEMCLADDEPVELHVNCDASNASEKCTVEKKGEAIVDAAVMASPTTTVTALTPTPEKPSRNGHSDPNLSEDNTILSKPVGLSPTCDVSSDKSIDSNNAAAAMMISLASSSEEEEERFFDVHRTTDGNRTRRNSCSQSVDERLLLPLNFTESKDDDVTVVISNVSAEGQAFALRRTRSELYNRSAAEDTAETTSYEIETAELQEILKQLPDVEHRSILSQLMIMTNARGQGSRLILALQIKDTLLISMEKYQVGGQTDKAINLIFHLARLKKSHRQYFGKCIFKAMSKMYSKTEKHKGQKQQQSKKNHRRTKSPPPPTIAILKDEGCNEYDDGLPPPPMA